MSETPQQALMRVAMERGVSLSALSRMLGRNVAYLQQFVGRGSPRLLPERERRMLADFLELDERVLGAAAERDRIAVPYVAVAAAAGDGRAVSDEALVRHESLDRSILRGAGIEPSAASMIDVAGESMAPCLLDGDRVLVDMNDRRIPRGGAVFVIRRDDALSVKRLVRRGGAIEVASDNPAYPTIVVDPAALTIVGRVRLLLRRL
jgi:phage repressor protein C with HTH and peptisase S24 domain